jgi:very-short-patch-repair endonuclease
VELDIDSDNGAIRIRPRGVEPQLALRAFFEIDNEGVATVRDFGKQFLTQAVDDKQISPFRSETFSPILREAATQLDTRGVYHPNQIRDITDRTVPAASDHLVVSDTWVIYARQRSNNVLIADLSRLKIAIEKATELPSATTRLVTEPSDERPGSSRGVGIGESKAGGSGTNQTIGDPEPDGTEDFFFPKQFNDEQIAIVKRLKTSDGMVVQGPPGTGKTHTIANIICHCLATGKRVLVTSKAAEPLVEVRNHIPEGIRDLVISLLSTEREGLKQLEQAIRILSNTAVRSDTDQLRRAIIAGQHRVAELHDKIDKIDRELLAWAEKHLTKVALKDQNEMTPAELAEFLVREQYNHAWLLDELDLDPKNDARFTNEDVSAARAARKLLGFDLAYLGKTLPAVADLPDSSVITGLHEDLVSAVSIEQMIAGKHFPVLSLTARDAVPRAERLLNHIQEVIEFFDSAAGETWLSRIFELWRRDGIDCAKTQLFNELIPVMSSLSDLRPHVLRDAVRLPDGVERHAEAVRAIRRAALGRRPFRAISFGNGEAKALLQQITVQGRQPESIEDWRKITTCVAWRDGILGFTAKWSAISAEFDLPPLEGETDHVGKWVADISSLLSQASRILQEHGPRITSEVKDLLPHGVDPRSILETRARAAQVAEAIKLNLSRIRLAGSRAKRADLIKRLSASSGSIVEKMKAFVEEDLGNPDLNGRQVGDRWEALCREVARVQDLKPHLDQLSRVADLIEQSGGVKWAQQLRTDSADGVDDPLLPGSWQQSWQWSRISGYLRRIDGRDRIRELSRLRLEYEDDCRKTFGEVVKNRTFLGLKRNLTDAVQSALVMFIDAITRIGAGKGIRAPRFRRYARSAMEKCYAAVPCWIMPTWRISEHLPTEIGSFDLVIVDEASQSSVEALPALMRGKQLLIVGDDRQVSPTAAFVEERKILLLRHNYLKNQPFAQLLLPGSSLYALANAVFPGTRIMLREHFRCVEPIIRFSFQFYPEPIIPLRIPKPSERLDPPLIDVYLPDGRKDKRKINRVEAEAIADEIENIVKHPRFAKNSIGIISLIGAQQAHFIQQLLLERVGEEAFHRHKIACGDSATFQGKERDIMFISMVSSPGDAALTSQVFQQRFNVALSRARDRMYLFRSVAEEDLKNLQDLRLKVIRHFKDPMPRAEEQATELIERCESGFERDLFTRLTSLRYCVTPQVGVGEWRIDLVIEGENDRRLAVELDGDKWHPPEKWLDDMLRQRAMERMGWKFWRCWASSFLRYPDDCMADLVSTLMAMGIEPIEREARRNIYTEHRTATSGESKAGQGDGASTILEPVVEVGDRVLVSYDEPPGQQAVITIAAEQHDPVMSVFKASSPTGISVLGKTVDDEVSITIGEQSRSATILAIDKIGKEDEREPHVESATVRETSGNRDGDKYEGRLHTGSASAAQTTGQPDPKSPAFSTQAKPPPAYSKGPPVNPLVEALRSIDSKFNQPRCQQCRKSARILINNEGLVIMCADPGCKHVERVDVQTLQRLAEHLRVACYRCNHTDLQSVKGKFSNYLRCACGENNSWQGVSERLGKQTN